MSARLRLAIVGAAHMHVDYVLDEVARRDDVAIVGVTDRDAGRLARLAERVGAPAYPTLADLLSAQSLDAAAVTTEPGHRAGVVARLLRAGIFTIVDKPMATTLAGLDSVVSALAGRPLLTMLLEKRRYPVALALKRVLEGGELGDVAAITASGPHKGRLSSRAAWYFDDRLYGGVVNDLTVHDLDLALWLMGQQPARVSAWISPARLPEFPEFPVAARALLETDGGLQAAIDVDWLQPESSDSHGDYAMRITGTRGRADIDFARDALTVVTHRRPAWRPDLAAPESPSRYAFDHLTKGAPLAISTADSLRASRLALLAEASAREGGRWIDARF